MHAEHYRHLLLLPLALLIAIASLLAVRSSGIEPQYEHLADDTPDACITRLLSAEEHGDAKAYLDCFTRAEREKLEANWRDPSQLASNLSGRKTGVVGCALTGLELIDANQAELVIERISDDHVTRQPVSLIQNGGRWFVANLSTPERHEPAIPYGTSVFTQEDPSSEH